MNKDLLKLADELDHLRLQRHTMSLATYLEKLYEIEKRALPAFRTCPLSLSQERAYNDLINL